MFTTPFPSIFIFLAATFDIVPAVMSTVGVASQAHPAVATLLTRNQIRGFWAAWGGWTLDGMDSFLYALVLVPALRDLLPRSGIAATQANIGFYGGVLFAIFLLGWGFAFLWGPLADRFGRVRTLVLTILCYSAFTFLGSVAAGVWTLALFSFLAGV